jgi:hypothetical protein
LGVPDDPNPAVAEWLDGFFGGFHGKVYPEILVVLGSLLDVPALILFVEDEVTDVVEQTLFGEQTFDKRLKLETVFRNGDPVKIR